MTKRTKIWGAIAIALVVSVSGILWSAFGVHQVSMTQTQLQQKIDASMPHTTEKGVTVSAVSIDLANDRINLKFDVSVTKLGITYLVGAETVGNVRYDAAAGAFYFQPEEVKLTKAQANGASVSEKVGGFIDKWVDSPKVQANKAEIMAGAEQLVGAIVQKSAAAVMSRVPVYTLPDTVKGTAVRVLLDDVEVKNGSVVAHLSLWRLTINVLLFLIALVVTVGVTIGLLRNPDWGRSLPII